MTTGVDATWIQWYCLCIRSMIMFHNSKFFFNKIKWEICTNLCSNTILGTLHRLFFLSFCRQLSNLRYFVFHCLGSWAKLHKSYMIRIEDIKFHKLAIHFRTKQYILKTVVFGIYLKKCKMDELYCPIVQNTFFLKFIGFSLPLLHLLRYKAFPYPVCVDCVTSQVTIIPIGAWFIETVLRSTNASANTPMFTFHTLTSYGHPFILPSHPIIICSSLLASLHDCERLVLEFIYCMLLFWRWLLIIYICSYIYIFMPPKALHCTA